MKLVTNINYLVFWYFCISLIPIYSFAQTPELLEIEVMIRFNDRPIGEVGIRVRGQDQFVSIRKDDLLKYSKQLFTPEKHLELDNNPAKEGYIDKEIFCQSLKKCHFNLETLELELEIALADFKAKDLSLRAINFEKEFNKKIISSAYYSGFLTHRTTYQSNHGDSEPRLFSQINSAFSISKSTIESNYYYQSNNENKMQRLGSLFTHDLDHRDIRIQAGDFNLRTTSFMNGTQIGGFRYSKEFSLSPRRINQPLNEYEFLVNRKSDVNIYINDRLFQTTVLAPGKYNVKDLPLNLGLNNIRIELIDESGYTETLFFPYIVDKELLEIGRSDFSYEVGTKTQSIDGDIVYNHRKEGLLGSFFHRLGVTKSWTPGFFAQVSRDSKIGGLNSVYGTKYGLIQWEGATSKNIDNQIGFTSRLTYVMRNFNLGTSSNREVRFRYQYLDGDFTRFGAGIPENIYQNQILVSYRERLVPEVSMTISSNYLVSNKTGYQDREAYNISFYHIPKARFSHNLTLQRSSDRDGLWESSILYFLNYNFGDRKHTASAYHNSRIDNSRLALRGRYQTEKALINTDLDTSENETSRTHNARARIRHNRVQLEGQHRVTSRDSTDNTVHQTNLTVANSISFAGNHFAISDPIGNSFMLVDTDDQLKGAQIEINSGGAYSPPKVDSFGPAVLSNLTPYQTSRIAVDTTELPEGVSMKEHTFFVKTRYKSGSLIKLKAKGSVAVYATLLNPDGTAFALKYFEFVNMDDPEERIESFTNDIGEFVLEGLSPGQYRLESDTNLTYILTITKEQRGLLELGKMRLKVK